MFGFGGSRNRMAGSELTRQILDGGWSDGTARTYGYAPGSATLTAAPSSPATRFDTSALTGSANLDGAAPAAIDIGASLAGLGGKSRDFFNSNRGAFTAGSRLLGGLAIAGGAMNALSDPAASNEEKLAGAAGNVAGGLGSRAVGGIIGAALTGGNPIGAMIGANVAPMIGMPVGEALFKTVARVGKSPEQKALDMEIKRRQALSDQDFAELQRRLPVELEAAVAKSQIEQAMLAKQAELQNQRDMQSGLIQAGLLRTQGQKAQDLALTQGIMSSIFG